MSDSSKNNKEYIQAKINPILEKLVVDALLQKPENVIDFMIKWLQDNGHKYQSSASPQKSSSQSTSAKKQKSAHRNAYGESSEEDEDDVEDLPMQSKAALKMPAGKPAQRSSVSAEAYGKFNQKGAFKAKYIEKTSNQIARIKKRLLQAFMFSALDDKELEIVVGAMEEKVFGTDEKVIEQGKDGDNLYIIDKGTLDCFKKFAGQDQPKFLKVYEPGESFGELALLYNAPRAATIIAKEECVLFALDRETFNNIVKDAASKKREKYESFLSKVELLESMDPYERSKIADALKPMKFKVNEFVVKEGETGDTFFLVEDGDAVASKVLQPGKNPETVYKYKSGDYFGELALLKDTPRAANILAVTSLSVLALDRLSFKRLIGPMEDLLKRNFARYEKFLG